MFQYFDGDMIHQVLYLCILPGYTWNLRNQPWRRTYFWCRTGICSWNLSVEVRFIHFQFHFFVIWRISDSILFRLAWKSPPSKCLFYKETIFCLNFNFLNIFLNFYLLFFLIVYLVRFNTNNKSFSNTYVNCVQLHNLYQFYNSSNTHYNGFGWYWIQERILIL